MSKKEFRIISDRAAASQILNSQGEYLAFWGAGISVEAGVPAANKIYENIARKELEIEGFDKNISFEDAKPKEWLKENLFLDDIDIRYAASLHKHFVNPADRVDFFRKTLKRISPSFAHYGAALIMNERIIGRTCLTTNFDKLLENAFIHQGNLECQALRTADEIKYWRPDDDRCFCLKLHGDYDTHNVLNTLDETVKIDKALKNRCFRLLEHKGLVVLGLAGYEKSIYGFFDDITSDPFEENGSLERGLLWGVYVGKKPTKPWSIDETENAVNAAINKGSIGPEIQRMMSRMSNKKVQFAFFPVFGSGQFFLDLIEMSAKKSLIGMAQPFLDHEMRLRRVFSKANLSSSRIEEHINKLKKSQAKSNTSDHTNHRVERAFKLNTGEKEVWVTYGDISSRSYLESPDFKGLVRAIVSPDDTYLSVGGGVAAALAHKAGFRSILHEVSKFVPISQGECRITSGGFLPVQYIIHSATIEVAQNGYNVTVADVRKTFQNILRLSEALGINVISVPLLGAGVAGLSPEDSFRGLLDGYKNLHSKLSNPIIVSFVIYREASLARKEALKIIKEIMVSPAEEFS